MANQGYVTIRLRRDSAATWTSVNPVLASGEPGFELNTGKLKIGDGSTAWSGLSYLSGSSGSEINVSSPSAISTSQNNYDPGSGDVLRLSASASGVNITGLVPRLEKIRLLINIGTTNNLTLVHESASSSSGNRFITPNGGNYIVAPTGSSTLFYDDTSLRWRVV